MDVKNVVIDAKQTIGEDLILVDIIPTNVYEGGKRTDKISGYRYVVAMPNHGFDKISVKIEGSKKLEMPEDEYPVVEFDELDMSIYWSPDGYRVAASAAGIRVV